jgi:hypothetical protein
VEFVFTQKGIGPLIRAGRLGAAAGEGAALGVISVGESAAGGAGVAAEAVEGDCADSGDVVG